MPSNLRHLLLWEAGEVYSLYITCQILTNQIHFVINSYIVLDERNLIEGYCLGHLGPEKGISLKFDSYSSHFRC